MRFSIIVPVYNTCEYISKCIESILLQDFHDYEIILINDGSTDGSDDICAHYALKDSRIHLINQENKGISATRNNGVSVAYGEYIIFLDSDDTLYNNKCLSILDRKIYGNCDVVAFAWKEVPDGEAESEYTSDQRAVTLQGEYKDGAEYLLNALIQYPVYKWFVGRYAFRREFWNLNNFLFPVNKVYEDVYLVWRVILNAKLIIVIPNTVYIYRTKRHGSIVISTSLKNEQDRLDIIEENIKNVNNFENIPEKLKLLLVQNFSAIYYSSLIFATTIKNRSEYKKLIDLLNEKKYLSTYAPSFKFKVLRIIMKIAGISCIAKLLGIRRFLKYRI